MKPFRVFSFTLGVIILLGLIAAVFPSEGIAIGKLTLYFPTLEEMIPGKNDDEESVDITQIIAQQQSLDSLINVIKVDSTNTEDSIAPADFEKLKALVHKIEFPADNNHVLDPFFKALQNQTKSSLIRVMHYGDSQIEGDRITSFLRSRLQKKFGGYGVGLLPVLQPYDFSFSIRQSNSDNWLRYTLNGRIDTNVRHNNYGALGSFSRFTPLVPIAGAEKSNAWVQFDKSNISYSNTRKFKRIRIFYGNATDSVGIKIYQNDSLLLSDTLRRSLLPAIYSYNFKQAVSNARIVFEAKTSPDIYGVSLESTTGVAVDNIGLRGNSGTIFTKINKQSLGAMYQALNVKLFILQFGGNVMPYIKSDKEAENYGRWFYSQLLRIKSVQPGASILVIGPSDMSIKVKDKYVSYEYLEKVRDELKKAAFNAGAAYWDMFEAMGGKNSMPSWVAAKPALAAPDYTHFTSKGVTVVSNMFYNALLLEYNNYKGSE